MNAHRWRTLVRVLLVTSEGIWCVFPAWDHKVAVLLDSTMFERPVESNFRFHAEVTLNAVDPNDLKPDKFEFPDMPGQTLFDDSDVLRGRRTVDVLGASSLPVSREIHPTKNSEDGFSRGRE